MAARARGGRVAGRAPLVAPRRRVGARPARARRRAVSRDELARPVAAAALVGAEVRGSVRAPVDFHVAAALEAVGAHLTKRGGHAAAGGFSARARDVGRLRRRPSQALARPFGADAGAEVQRPGRQVVDLVLPARFLDWELADELLRLAPYGPGHLEPVLAVTGLRVARRATHRREGGARLVPHAARARDGRRHRVRRRRRARAARGGHRARSRRHPGARRVRRDATPAPAGHRLRRCGRRARSSLAATPAVELARAG